ncbi:MAG: HlyD family type I secretion periplasmic adaptor subunit [Gammaproteobacteria bacterium]|jgi:epimerase transport system membrane fusion protein|nr:HlyD family type I secretion periplasmic adaptor subunit [Gammaproteobacteria bacterium]
MANDNQRKQVASQQASATDQQVQAPEQPDWEEVDEKPAGIDGEYTRQPPPPAGTGELPTDYTRRIRTGIMIVLVTFVGLGGWAGLAPLDGAVIAPGQVLVDSQNRVVQHLEGGIVAELHVRDGSRIEQGQLLLALSDTRARSELEIVESQLLEVLGREARLRAERVAADTIDFPGVLLEQNTEASSNILRGQQSLFESRRESLHGQIAIYEQRISALNQQIQGLSAMNRNLDSRIDSYREELDNWLALFEQELADRTRINEMQRELFRLEGERAGNDSNLAELEIRIGETRSELLVTRQRFAEEVSTQLREAQQSIADLSARQIAVRDTLQRTSLLAPATGTVVGLSVHTIGAVIRPGDTILSIVPEDQQYIVSARVQTPDIDRIRLGQQADVRLSAFNQQTHDIINGELLHISADAFEDDKTGERYYEVRIGVTEQGRQTMDEQGMYMMAGMPAEVMINTGERTALQYLLDPITRMLDRALREE